MLSDDLDIVTISAWADTLLDVGPQNGRTIHPVPGLLSRQKTPSNAEGSEPAASTEYSVLAAPGGAVLPGTVQADGLQAWAKHLPFVQAAARVLGVPTHGLEGIESGKGKLFRCILPGHTDQHPSASLFRGRTGDWVYRDWHAATPAVREWLTLADCRAALAYGAVKKLAGPEQATWLLRLLVETQFVVAAPVAAAQLPLDAPAGVRKVYAGFLFLLGCKWLHTPDAPTSFSWRFGAAWCGLNQRTVGGAIRWLLARAYVQQVGQKRAIAEFLPGQPRPERLSVRPPRRLSLHYSAEEALDRSCCPSAATNTDEHGLR